jgi:hypothetical protein
VPVAGPGERELAGLFATHGSQTSLVRIRLEPFSIVTKRVDEFADVGFLDARRVVMLPSGGRRARIYTPSLEVASSFPWTAYRSALAGATAFGVGFNGRLHRAPLPSGPERVVRRLPGPNVSVIVPVR